MIGKAARFLAKHAKSSVEKTGMRHFDNMWSGYELNGKGKKIMYTGLLGYGGYSVASGVNNAQDQRALNQLEYAPGIESLPSSRADGAGYMANPGDDKNLGATGDLVFALHKLRHGGAE